MEKLRKYFQMQEIKFIRLPTLPWWKHMRQFYLTFQNSYALRSELSWTHYRLLMRVENVAQEIQTLEQGKTPEDIIRDPYVLEFLGLSPNDDFYESDLEQALITHLQKFLLELG